MRIALPEPLRARLFFARLRIRNPAACRAYRELERNQRLPPAELRALNWRKRRDLLLYAFDRIPFYRARYGALGLRERHFDDPAVWDSIPPLTRQDVAGHFDDLRAPDWPGANARISATGGTTGAPVKVLHDLTFPAAALSWRLLQWWGVSPDSEQARVARFTEDDLRRKGKTRKLEEARLSVSEMDADALDRFVSDWNRLRPKQLSGYVAGIHLAALHILGKGLRVHPPVAIRSTTAPLTAGMRKRIEEAFGAPVYDQYGSCEIYWLAAECRRQNGLHILCDARHVEAADAGGRALPPGESGRLLVTDLENRAFPLIRYANGDAGRLLERPCECGITLPLMEPVKGRETDNLRLPDGTVIGGVYLTTLFDDRPDAVLAFQVHQAADYAVELRVVPNPAHGRADEDIEAVRRILLDRVRSQVPLRVTRVAEIEPVKGKTRYIVSEVG